MTKDTRIWGTLQLRSAPASTTPNSRENPQWDQIVETPLARRRTYMDSSETLVRENEDSGRWIGRFSQ